MADVRRTQVSAVRKTVWQSEMKSLSADFSNQVCLILRLLWQLVRQMLEKRQKTNQISKKVKRFVRVNCAKTESKRRKMWCRRGGGAGGQNATVNHADTTFIFTRHSPHVPFPRKRDKSGIWLMLGVVGMLSLYPTRSWQVGLKTRINSYLRKLFLRQQLFHVMQFWLCLGQ